MGSEGTPVSGRQFAWQVHTAIQSWTASVDAKASIVLIVETGIAAAGATALISNGGELNRSTGLQLGLGIAAVATLVLSVGSALWVVFPRLNYRSLNKPGYIYFGQLAQRQPEEIRSALFTLNEREEISQLADQLAITSQIAWRKHVWLQRSIALVVIGAVLLLCSLVAF